MLSKFFSLTLADWFFIVLFDVAVFYAGTLYAKKN